LKPDLILAGAYFFGNPLVDRLNFIREHCLHLRFSSFRVLLKIPAVSLGSQPVWGDDKVRTGVDSTGIFEKSFPHRENASTVRTYVRKKNVFHSLCTP
jgi:hypothetical protein